MAIINAISDALNHVVGWIGQVLDFNVDFDKLSGLGKFAIALTALLAILQIILHKKR